MQDASSKQQTKQKYRPSSQQTGLPPHSAVPIRGKTNKQTLSTNLTLYEAHTNHWTNLIRQKPKGRKNSTLKTEKRRTQTQRVKKNNEKVEKYYTNEGTNQKHRSPNK